MFQRFAGLHMSNAPKTQVGLWSGNRTLGSLVFSVRLGMSFTNGRRRLSPQPIDNP
jgi:hypothetical protein